MVRNTFLKRPINQCKNQLLRFLYYNEFLIFYEFDRRFFKCRLLDNNSRKSAENLCEQCEIKETNNSKKITYFQ